MSTSLPEPTKNRIIVISGRIGAGKTTLASHLARELPATLVRTRSVLDRVAGEASADRPYLQALGRRLDEETGGQWVATLVLSEVGDAEGWAVVDAVRIAPQLVALRQLGKTLHIHLTAPLPVLAQRYNEAHGRPREYDNVSTDPTEMEVEDLALLADLVLDTADADAAAVQERALTLARAAV